MILNFVELRCFRFNALAVAMLASAVAACGTVNLQAQDNNGVKIELKLNPSIPENPAQPATKEAKEAESKEAESPETGVKESMPKEKAGHNPFVLSAFQIVSDKGAYKDERPKPKPKAQPLSALSLELPPSHDTAAKAGVKDTKASASDSKTPTKDLKKTGDGAPPKVESSNGKTIRKLDGSLDKPKQLKPLKIESSDADSKDDNEDAECPGGTEGSKPLPVLPDDIPLKQDDHPYDAPAAESSSAKPDRPAGRTPLQLSNEQMRLRTEINQLLRYYIQHPETTTRRSPWAVMHAILPYGVEAELAAGNRRVNAIGWMSYNGLCKTQRIFQPTKSGFRTNLGPGVQGHEGQFLAILAQSKVAPNYPIKVGERSYTVNDLVRLEMATCREKSELTFKLIGLSYYLEPNQRWRDNQGGNWSLEKLVAEELEQPVVGAACGGTHRLMGLTFSLLQRKQAGLPIDGHWERSEQFLNEFVAYAFSLQNPDGSFSTEWFEARANDPNVERKIQTTGHILEWLIYTLPDDQLQSPPVQKAIRYLLSTLGAEPGRDWPIGPRGHSLRALALYNQRVFGAEPGKLKQYIANLNTESKQR
ncbi:MAG: hypothetical protein SFV81_05220 [Pirellulaceae bacterium]|nr:hypothetical protein [Pirellulaceae bacterium]